MLKTKITLDKIVAYLQAKRRNSCENKNTDLGHKLTVPSRLFMRWFQLYNRGRCTNKGNKESCLK
jgi:hypothetical protein